MEKRDMRGRGDHNKVSEEGLLSGTSSETVEPL